MTKRNIDSDLGLAILGLLSIYPLSGYGLRKVFLTTAMGNFSASPGAIYPALRNLEAAGLVKGTVENARTLRPRKAFALTAEGRAALKSALSRPITREDVMKRMDNILLRFSFMDGLMPKEAILSFLSAFRTEAEAYAEVLEKEIRRDGPRMPFCGRAAAELGLEGYRVNARWAERIYARLRKEPAVKGETP
jgi:PadR family transcriptional regulator, phenolic acid-responsive transcriptional regulator